MSKMAAIVYIDALYFLRGEKLKFITFSPHVAMGRLLTFDEHIVIVFTEKEAVPEKGLLVPKSALILKGRSKSAKAERIDLSSLKNFKNADIGVFWKDLVYFENGKIPSQPTVMYTEGKIFKITSDAVIIKYPETIKIKGKSIEHHPKSQDKKVEFLIIPKSFIIFIELYDKKV